jgi:tetratricopeptide (TPR) repeat protein
MDTYLVLHIDLEFIAASICKSNGSHFSIKNLNEELLWLYFFNDPNLNRITFGKANRQHFHNLEVNYHGDFCNQILDDNEKFTRNGIQKPVIELLENSGMLRLFVEKYKERDPLAQTEIIPTLVTFSSTINDSAKKKLIEYFESKNFKIESHSIPFAELTSQYYLKETKISVNKSKIVLFLEATNSTLHLMKLNYISGHFFVDKDSVETYPGKGYDPRKRAIINFVVNEVNKSTGLLNRDEIDRECARFEANAEQWLKRVDAAGENSPVNIQGIWLSPAQSIQRNVLVRKEHIEEDTGYFINDLINIYRTFEDKLVEDKQVEDKESISAVVLIGECFNNNLIRDKFLHLLKDKLIIAPLSKLNEIQAVYPEIDLKKYADEKERDKIIKKAHDESRSQEEEFQKKRKRELEEQEKRQQEIANRQIAKENYGKAKQLKDAGKLDEAITKAEKANSLDPSNAEIRKLYDELIKEKEDIDVKAGRLALYLKEAEDHLLKDELIEALSKYKLAQKITDTGKIRDSIENIYAELEERKKRKDSDYNKKLTQGYIEEVDRLVQANKLSEAMLILDKAIELGFNNTILSKKRAEVEALIDIQTNELNQLSDEAEIFLGEGQLDKAEAFCREALKRRPDDDLCLALMDKISEARNLQAENEKKFRMLVDLADASYSKEEWDRAEKSYKEALLIKKNEKHCQIQLSNILLARKKEEERRKKEEQRLAEKEKEYSNLIDQGSTFVVNKEWDNAKNIYNKALLIKQNDDHCLAQLAFIEESLKQEEESKKAEEKAKAILEKEYNSNLELASQYFKSKNWNEAEKLYNKILKKYPDDSDAKRQLSQISIRRQEEQEEKEAIARKKSEDERLKNEVEKPEKPDPVDVKVTPSKPSTSIFKKYKKALVVVGFASVIIAVAIIITTLHPTSGRVKKISGKSNSGITDIKTEKIVTPRDSSPAKPDEHTVDNTKVVKPEQESSKNSEGSSTSSNQTVTQNKVNQPQSRKSEEPERHTKVVPVSNHLDFNYGSYDGPINDGKMNGFGKITFTSTYILFKGEPDEIKVEKGFYLEGKWNNGEFYRGNLFDNNKARIKSINRGQAN